MIITGIITIIILWKGERKTILSKKFDRELREIPVTVTVSFKESQGARCVSVTFL